MRRWWLLGLLLFSLTACRAQPDNPALPRTAVKVPAQYRTAFGPANRTLQAPKGFAVSVFAAGLKGPRHMAQGPDGAIYVAEKPAGRVSRLLDGDGDGAADRVEPWLEKLEMVNSLAWHDGDLYAGATDGIYRYKAPVTAGSRGEKIVSLPSGGAHYTRTVHFGPEQRIYVSIGSTCNVCIETEPHRATIWVYNRDGTGGRVFAQGLRNTVDFAFHPASGALFGVENGRDGLGDDRPAEELNWIRDGSHYGWPYCHATDIVDPQVGRQGGGCAGKTAPVLAMQAHSAPLGMQFYTGNQFPADMRGNLFIALHGSWNRSTKTGYKVVQVPFRDGMPVGEPQDFLAGWLTGDASWGRPVGLLQTADGALLVSDDQDGVIYRITFAPQ